MLRHREPSQGCPHLCPACTKQRKKENPAGSSCNAQKMCVFTRAQNSTSRACQAFSTGASFARAQKHFCEGNKEKALSLGVPACVCRCVCFPAESHEFQIVCRVALLLCCCCGCGGRNPARVLTRGAGRPAVGAGEEGEGAHQGVCAVCLSLVVGGLSLFSVF